MSTHRLAGERPTVTSTRHTVRHVVILLLTPLLMCLGMGMAYLGAFHAPHAHGLKVAVIGSSPRYQVLAQTIKDRAGDALDVTTVPNRAAAQRQIMDRDLVSAYVPSAKHPELLVAKANSDTSAAAAEAVFTTVAGKQGAPMRVTDLSQLSSGDPTGQGLFFLLVALSIGSYASVAAISAGGATLRVGIRAVIGLGTALVVSVIGTVLAGPVFHIADHHLLGLWGMALLYSAGILTIGIALHTFLKRWTTLALMVLFVMLNFTSSGGIFQPALQNGFFGALHAFWNGAGFVEGVRSLLYFDSADSGGCVLTLVLWLVAGLLLLAAAAVTERRTAPAPAPTPPANERQPTEDEATEEEMGEAVAV
ncbi:ABC-2 transporter permease [Streptomyces chiangmaiensis]|uniref:ABC transporter permease n=1 Tax=Streptomyces chiangmaiensis TaxID=766497 RepID=A0ABU7FG35_9ACTN|nr:hypothetical protein [Streptomyces chiangmaiensis]MED7822895.1 hypothetical protein [Streptomyces chiangmaiensis]